MKKELILCFNKEQALALKSECLSDATELMARLDEIDQYFIPRYIAEDCKDLIHPIPYFAVQNTEGLILLYQRGKGVGESRLSGNHSIGFGGHVELEKDGINNKYISTSEEIILNAMHNEHDEELSVTGVTRGFGLLDVIYDDSNEVGKVHLGIASKIVVDSATINEPELIDCGWFSVKELLELHHGDMINLENWSVELLKMLESNS